MATEFRPVPLPTRPAPAATPTAKAGDRRPTPPPGATKWAKVYLDQRGMPVQSADWVPVDDNDRRTAHTLHTCRGQILVGGVNQPCDNTAWLLDGDPQRYCPEHGCELARVDGRKSAPALPWLAMWKAIEPAARPAWLLPVAVAAGAAEQAGHLPVMVPVASTPLLAVGAYAVTRWRLRRRAVRRGNLERGQRTGRRVATIRRRARAAGYAAATAGGWLTAVAVTNPGTPVGKIAWVSLPVLWAVASQPWRRYLDALRNRPLPALAPLPAAGTASSVDSGERQPDPAAVDDAKVWAEDVAAVRSELKNTTVDVATWQPDVGGRRMVIRSTRGSITEEAMRAAVPAIAGAFNVKRSTIGWVEEYDESPRAALLLLQPNSPLNKPVRGKPVDVVSLDEAVAHMGMRIDASDLVTRLFTRGWGAPSRLIIGTKGSGKTSVVRRLLFAQLKARVMCPSGQPARLIAPFVDDPKRGADYGLFRRLVCGFSVEPDTLHMIVDAFGREMDRRYDALASTVWQDDEGRLWEGERPFDPTTMGPILSLTCDEFHVRAKDQALMAKLDPFGRKMRAAGIEINVATHLSTIGDTGSQGFRDMLAGGEAWLLRTTLGLNASLATGGQLTGDPRALPRVAGMLLHASGEGSATMQARAAYDEPATLYDQVYGPNRTPLIQPIEWPPETLEAFGRDFVEWMRECQESALGTPVPAVPRSLKTGTPAAAGQDLLAEEALRRILFASTAPMSRGQIAEHPLWAGRSVTSTLTAVLRAGQDCKPPWLVKLPQGKGVYDLTADIRQHMTDAASEDSDGQEAA
jgi:hypothetical protein